MNADEIRIHNAAIRDALRKIELMQGYTLSRKLTVKAVRSCLIKKQKRAEEVAELKIAR